MVFDLCSFHTKAFPEYDRKKLEFFGFVQYRSGGEFHLNNPAMSKALHSAVKQGPNYDHFKTYKALLESRPATALRDLLTFSTNQKPIPLEQVESIESIWSRKEDLNKVCMIYLYNYLIHKYNTDILMVLTVSCRQM